MFSLMFLSKCVFAYTFVQICACERSLIFWACVFAYIFVQVCVRLYFCACMCSPTFFFQVCVCLYFSARVSSFTFL